MKLLIIIITLFFIVNTYYDGKYLDILKSWTKYYKIIAIAFAGVSLYLVWNRNPYETRDFISTATSVISKLPVDTESKHLFTPFLSQDTIIEQSPQINRLRHSGSSNKRSVSETKKKYVAAQQGWKCGRCQRQLPAWFEVDHTVRLEHGGTNHVDNLVALCRDCHGEKTALENL